MPIEPISSELTAPAVPAHPLPSHDSLSPSQDALAQAQAVEQETVEQRADHGDPIALDQLAKEQAQLTPIRSQGLEPAHLPHGAGATEPGKGGLIDVYD